MRRFLIFLMITAVITPAATALVGAQSDSGGPFDREALVETGVHDSDAPPSVRQLGDPVRGGIAIRHVPASPLQTEWQYVEPAQTIKTDRIQLYSTAYGSATGDYQLVAVQWRDETRSVESENGTRRVPVAADQTVQRVDVEIEDGYATTEVNLASSYNETKEVTMWLERDGDRVDGATWRFRHTSVAAGEAVDIDTRADAWWYAGRTAILPGVAGIIAGLSLARGVLKKAGRGPGYSLGLWLIIGTIGLTVGLGGLYYEIASLIAHFDIVMGLSLGVVAFGGGMRMHAPVEKIGFERQILTDGVSLRRSDDVDVDVAADGGTAEGGTLVEIPEEGYFDELYEDLPILPTVRAEDGLRRVPMTGIRPFFARLFADPAKLNLDSLQTRIKVASGAIAEKIYVDPESEPAVEHKPARLKRRMPVWHRLADRDAGDVSTTETVLYGALTLAAFALPAIGYYVGDALAQAPIIGATVGLVGLVVESYTAVDGSLHFEPAPRHFLSANASLTVLQSEHADAKTLEEFEEIIWDERTSTALETRELESRRDKSISQDLNERALGMDLDVLSSDEEEELTASDLVGGKATRRAEEEENDDE
ncbi:hypothetical protein DVK02_12900 [Halobellus sp. Atlit-31R]|nr:hypothetical protein DVK02_12900 [Halobellus sp. Atlit-31R]